MVIMRDGFFYPILTQIMDSFSCSPLHTSFLLKKNMQKAPRKSQYAKMRQDDVILHYNVMDRHAAIVHLFAFYLSQWLVGVCEMGKINGNLDLVCENILSITGFYLLYY